MEGHHAERAALHRELAWVAWHAAYLPRTKHAIALSTLLGDAPASKAARPLRGQEADDARRAHEALVKRLTGHGG